MTLFEAIGIIESVRRRVKRASAGPALLPPVAGSQSCPMRYGPCQWLSGLRVTIL